MGKDNVTPITGETAEQELARLRAENTALKAGENRTLTCKVGEKGGVAVYGLGKFPVTLYMEQWEKLIDFAPTIAGFIEANRDKLKTKLQSKGERLAAVA